MVILNVKLDNIYGFRNFEINFSYPKKIVNSLIPSEHLPGRLNFRYKKAVILMGANASGKTTLGKALYVILNYLRTDDSYGLWTFRGDDNIPAKFSIDFVAKKNILSRFTGDLSPKSMFFDYFEAEIREQDSYEKAVKRLKGANIVGDDFAFLKYRFAYPGVTHSLQTDGLNPAIVQKVLESVIGTLDPTLANVSISKDLKDSFIIRKKGIEVIIQDGKLLNKEALSSGTIEGVDISMFLAGMLQENDCFYYCDEHFSYIQSDIEKRIFGIMLDHLGDYDQLIFTTHNMDMLDLNLPKHAYAFLRKKPDENGDYKISAVYADEYLKRNTDSIRSAVENDIFDSLPDDSLLDQLDREYAF